MDPQKIKRYYSIFINTMAALARDFDATVIKNTGDSVIFYFPKTTDSSNNNMSAFKNVFECGLTMISVNPIINVKLQKEEGLPVLCFRQPPAVDCLLSIVYRLFFIPFHFVGVTKRRRIACSLLPADTGC